MVGSTGQIDAKLNSDCKKYCTLPIVEPKRFRDLLVKHLTAEL